MNITLGVGIGSQQRPPAWSPSSSANLVLWLDARDLPLADGAAVASWPDRSGAGLAAAAVQATANYKPTFKTQLVGGGPITPAGLPAVYFSTDDWLSANGLAARFTGTDKPFTVAAVVRLAADAALSCLWGTGHATQTALYYLFAGLSPTNGKPYLLRVVNSNKAAGHPTGVGTAAAHVVLMDQGDTTPFNGRTQIDGGASSTADLSGLGAMPTQSLCTIGSINRGGTLAYPLNGYVCALAVYDRALTEPERATLAAYMKALAGTA
ncbi:MAG: hypothetical protein NT029_08260 [Armatimonadetes bacterium]|nr:hypothetical protein [Armatimonadota bacterium]